MAFQMDSESFHKEERLEELQLKSSVIHSYISEGEVDIIIREGKINTLQNELKLLKYTILELKEELIETAKALEKFTKQNSINKSHNEDELQLCVENNDNEETESINGSLTKEELLTVGKIEIQNEDQNELLHMEFFQEENVSNNEISQSCKLATASSNVTENKFKNEDVTENFCDKCGKKISAKYSLKKHFARVHLSIAAFRCSKCLERFSNKRDLRHHFLALHCGKKLYQCDICKKLYMNIMTLQAHLKCHISKRKYHCLECDRSFFMPSALKLHERVHTGERPFQCPVCDKSFRQISSMRYHYRTTHTGEKPYKCQICDKTFRINGDLKIHCYTWH